ncbi:MAG: endonuclease/exonuclease/phosphatase family protein [Planctomycetes bacterium]|nr:endonuclease/exonuclease/phosphatase family protein [Planctomycetota bacterium]MCW8136599.1 endonuclease/exonuclease/phosphatase family protein [Planctomycetota bacterium]
MRILSYNIHKGIGGRDRLYRLERIIDVIREQHADIVCLQEVDRNVKRSGFDDQPALLQQAFGYDFAIYQFNHRVGDGGYGNLVLSRFPIIRRHNISLRYRGRKNRRAQLALIDARGVHIRLVNWHLGLGEAERQWQTRHLLTHESYREYGDAVTLVAGDFNDWRNTLQSGALAEQMLAQVSAPPSRFRTFPAYLPVGALDKVFVCNRIALQRAHVVRSTLAARASDHLPLVVDLDVK